MTKFIAAAVFSLCLAPSVIRAQSFEKPLDSMDRSVAKQARSIAAPKPIFAGVIACGQPEKKSGLPAGLRFYTRLEAIASVSQLPVDDKHAVGVMWQSDPKADETAAKLDDYRSSRVSQEAFRYDTWSCDTEDFYFAFPTQGLLRQSPGQMSRPIKARVLIETRGDTEYTGEIDCTAFFN